MSGMLCERSWSFGYAAALPAGPWADEPDKIQWIDETTGLDCLIIRHPLSGHLCGYVGVGPDHPFHGREYGEAPLWDLDVHGGLSYAAPCSESGLPEAVCHIPEPGRPADVWWFGFDCAHFRDRSPAWDVDGTYKTVGYVQEQCADLAAQLAALK